MLPSASKSLQAAIDGEYRMSKMHLVFGGRVKDPQGLDFEDLSKIDVVGFF